MSNLVDVTLDVGIVYTYVRAQKDEIHTEIDNILSVKVPWAYWTGAYKMGFWDGYRKFYDVLRGRFLSGFSFKVAAHLMQKGFKVQMNNVDKVFGAWNVDVGNLTLNGIDEVRWKETQLPVLRQLMLSKRGVVKMGTGSGKTEVMAGILKALSDKSALVLVHRIELLHQTIDRLKMRLGEEIGMVCSGKVDIDKRVVVGMVQSVWSKKPVLAKWLKDGVQVLLIDECHHSPSKTWSYIAMSCGALWRYGFSGTPLTYNEERDMLLIGLTGDVIYGVQLKDLVEKGYAARPRVNIVIVPFRYNGKWSQVFDEVYGKDMRMVDVLKFVLESEIAKGKKGIVLFVERIRHGKRLLSYLREKGWNVVFAYGGRSDAERICIMQGMKQKRYDVVIATTIFDEGIDVSGINGVVFWCSTKSIVRIMQRIGRGVRVEQGKADIDVWEFVVDNRYIKEHSKKRISYYDKEGLERRFWLWTGNQLIEIEKGSKLGSVVYQS
jgi:superfamily II DNA or RNA helicase